jgi:kynurenine 3-monooxygenase
MVMFHPEIPYAEAFRRGERQGELLERLTEGHTRIEDIDLNKAESEAIAWLDRA